MRFEKTVGYAKLTLEIDVDRVLSGVPSEHRVEAELLLQSTLDNLMEVVAGNMGGILYTGPLMMVAIGRVLEANARATGDIMNDLERWKKGLDPKEIVRQYFAKQLTKGESPADSSIFKTFIDGLDFDGL